MLSRRNWILRFSIILNVIVLCYVGTHFVSYNNGVELMEEVQTTGRNVGLTGYSEGANTINLVSQGTKTLLGGGERSYESEDKVERSLNEKSPLNEELSRDFERSVKVNGSWQVGDEKKLELDSVIMSIPGKVFVDNLSYEKVKTTEESEGFTSYSEANVHLLSRTSSQNKKTLEEIIKCHDGDQILKIAQRGDFWVLYNFVTPSRKFRCFETITYTTHSDYTFLDNLEPLVERWRGPISLALHAPGTDFNATLNTIQYLRKCGSPLISELVTFHVYFGSRFVPKKILKSEQLANLKVNCSHAPPWVNVTSKQLFKSQKKILYPVNVGRNIAREAAVTYYILPSDIELYPSPGLIEHFLNLVRRQDPPLLRKNPKVFVLPIFELEAGAVIPANKTQLVSMLKAGRAIPFHKKVCPRCHSIPKSREWILATQTEGLHVFYIGKRMGYFLHWEPIFIGTHQDPFYDERLSWEGKSDKMTQGYALCVLDYEFHILDNAFLVHKPGIKTIKKDTARAIMAAKTNSFIKKEILPQLKVLYGTRKGCAV